MEEEDKQEEGKETEPLEDEEPEDEKPNVLVIDELAEEDKEPEGLWLRERIRERTWSNRRHVRTPAVAKNIDQKTMKTARKARLTNRALTRKRSRSRY